MQRVEFSIGGGGPPVVVHRRRFRSKIEYDLQFLRHAFCATHTLCKPRRLHNTAIPRWRPSQPIGTFDMRQPLRLLSLAVFGLAAFSGPAPGQSVNSAFQLRNNSSHIITTLFVAPAGTGSWGENQLTAGLVPGQYITVRPPAAQCLNDIRVVFDDGRAQEWRDQDTCRLTNFTVN